MEQFRHLSALAAPLPLANIDTDIIFPARFLLLTEKRGLGRYAFYEWRYGPGDLANPDFVLNQPAYRDIEILVAGDNFGCGSSREQACWALWDMGVRVVISTSFGEIFYANCFKNGMLPVVVQPADLQALLGDAVSASALAVDLQSQQITRADGQCIGFHVEGWRREALLNGWDEVEVILNRSAGAIRDYEARAQVAAPWLFKE